MARQDPHKNYRELSVRSRVVKGMANIYMERHVQDLGQRHRVLKLLKSTADDSCGASSAASTISRLRRHIEARVDAEYPKEEFGSEDGAIPRQICEMLDAGGEASTEPSLTHPASDS